MQLVLLKNKLSQEKHPVVSKLQEKISNIKNEVFENFSKKLKIQRKKVSFFVH